LRVVTKRAKKEFMKNWKKTERYLLRNGMDREAVREMMRFDYEQFMVNRKIALHERCGGFCTENETDLIPCDRYGKTRTRFIRAISGEGRGVREYRKDDWKEADNEALAAAAAVLRDEDLSMLSMVYSTGLTVKETAQALGRTPDAVSRRLSRIRDIIVYTGEHGSPPRPGRPAGQNCSRGGTAS